MAHPSFRCPVCDRQGPTVEAGPEARAEAKQLFAEHLDRHTQPELTAFVWKIMYDHTISSVVPGRV